MDKTAIVDLIFPYPAARGSGPTFQPTSHGVGCRLQWLVVAMSVDAAFHTEVRNKRCRRRL